MWGSGQKKKLGERTPPGGCGGGRHAQRQGRQGRERRPGGAGPGGLDHRETARRLPKRGFGVQPRHGALLRKGAVGDAHVGARGGACDVRGVRRRHALHAVHDCGRSAGGDRRPCRGPRERQGEHGQRRVPRAGGSSTRFGHAGRLASSQRWRRGRRRPRRRCQTCCVGRPPGCRTRAREGGDCVGCGAGYVPPGAHPRRRWHGLGPRAPRVRCQGRARAAVAGGHEPPRARARCLSRTHGPWHGRGGAADAGNQTVRWPRPLPPYTPPPTPSPPCLLALGPARCVPGACQRRQTTPKQTLTPLHVLCLRDVTAHPSGTSTSSWRCRAHSGASGGRC